MGETYLHTCPILCPLTLALALALALALTLELSQNATHPLAAQGRIKLPRRLPIIGAVVQFLSRSAPLLTK